LLHRQYYQPFESQTGRAHRAIHRTSTAFADVLGKFYLAETMTSEKQEAVSAMVEDIKLSMAANIKEWQMTGGDSVKQILLERLKGMPVEILAPPTWQSYRDLMLHDLDEPVSMFAFEKEVRRFVRRRELVRTESIQAGVPVQSPGVFVVNEKKVLITPAFLQAPFYWGNDETAANYGAAGTWIARVLLQELRGSVALPSTSDRTSRVRTHESAEDAVWKNLDSESVNVAWEALQRTIREDGELDSLEGFSPHQQFFLALAASRRGKSIEQNIKLVEKGKAVQPAPNPINVLLSGSEPFQQVFRTAPGDRMYRAFGVLPDKLAKY
jgi:putative endopeptidase